MRRDRSRPPHGHSLSEVGRTAGLVESWDPRIYSQSCSGPAEGSPLRHLEKSTNINKKSSDGKVRYRTVTVLPPLRENAGFFSVTLTKRLLCLKIIVFGKLVTTKLLSFTIFCKAQIAY